MSRMFIYARVSTPDEATDNQVMEIEAAGFRLFRIESPLSASVEGSPLMHHRDL